MLNPRAVALIFAILAPLGGCATVSVYQPSSASAEISLTEPQSDLYKASDAYCEQARKKGWASGEASLGGLSAIFTGASNDQDAYWRKIGADKVNATLVLNRVRADAGDAAKGLTQLNQLAQKLMVSTKPTRTDVSEFEKVLIHARQARDSFSEAIAQANKRASREAEPATELSGLDKALASARLTADDLAAARTSDKIASL
ncbi:MAG: hypothetical protein GC155_06650 [Alphaproteobacteria bacterium]|nr:hypothetical protein [Alphaproteobacteria bacterium]